MKYLPYIAVAIGFASVLITSNRKVEILGAILFAIGLFKSF